jgi:hypothetical protein
MTILLLIIIILIIIIKITSSNYILIIIIITITSGEPKEVVQECSAIQPRIASERRWIRPGNVQ